MQRTLRALLLGLTVSSIGLSLGCGSDTTAPSINPAQQYWQLSLNHHAITLATVAPYDTIQLIATPKTSTGTAIPTTARPTFTTSDTSITIDSTGFVKVHGTQTKTRITVIATLTVGGMAGLTLSDTAVVNVVQWTSAASVPVLTTFRFQPAAGDSARRAVLSDSGNNITQELADSLLDAMGNAIPNTLVRYTSANSMVAEFPTATTGTVTPVAPGIVLLTAETNVYGVSKLDSLTYTVGYPLGNLDIVGSQSFGYSFTPSPIDALSEGTITIGVGGVVAWLNNIIGFPNDSLDIVFSDSTHVKGLTSDDNIAGTPFGPSGGGNIPAFGTPPVDTFIFPNQIRLYGFPDSTCTRGRVFPSPGTYAWHSTLHPLAGVVHVISNDSIR